MALLQTVDSTRWAKQQTFLLLASSVFDLQKLDESQIKSQTMRHTLMNSVNTKYFENTYVDT